SQGQRATFLDGQNVRIVDFEYERSDRILNGLEADHRALFHTHDFDPSHRSRDLDRQPALHWLEGQESLRNLKAEPGHAGSCSFLPFATVVVPETCGGRPVRRTRCGEAQQGGWD